MWERLSDRPQFWVLMAVLISSLTALVALYIIFNSSVVLELQKRDLLTPPPALTSPTPTTPSQE
jgi:hypothetical protein